MLAFWYDTYVPEGKKSTSPSNAWILHFTAIQDNDPNMVNKLSVGMLPDKAHLDSQLAEIKPGGTVASSIAYELTDLETPVTLIAKTNMFLDEEAGRFDFEVK